MYCHNSNHCTCHVWITAYYTEIRICQMGIDHLMNSFKLILRKLYDYPTSTVFLNWYHWLSEELFQRKLMIPMTGGPKKSWET